MPLPSIVLAALGFGLATGLIEVVIHLIRKLALGRILAFGMDFVWMTPLANALIFLLLALGFLLLALPFKRLRSPIVVYSFFGTVMLFGPLLLADRIHKAAALVLALGLSVAIARGLARRAEGVHRFLLRAVPLLLVVLPLVGAGRLYLTQRRHGLSRGRHLAGVHAGAAGIRRPGPV